MTKLYSRQAENAVKIPIRGKKLRQDEVESRFFHTALGIITNTNAKFKVTQTGDDKFMFRTKIFSKELSNSRANNSSCSGLIIIELIRDLRVIYILTKFGTN